MNGVWLDREGRARVAILGGLSVPRLEALWKRGIKRHMYAKILNGEKLLDGM